MGAWIGTVHPGGVHPGRVPHGGAASTSARIIDIPTLRVVGAGASPGVWEDCTSTTLSFCEFKGSCQEGWGSVGCGDGSRNDAASSEECEDDG